MKKKVIFLVGQRQNAEDVSTETLALGALPHLIRTCPAASRLRRRISDAFSLPLVVLSP